MLSREMTKAIKPLSSYKYLGILEAGGIKHDDMKEMAQGRAAATSEKNIGSKAKRQRHNVSNKLAPSRSSAVWPWNPEMDKEGTKGVEQKIKKASNDECNPSPMCRH